MLVTGIFSFSHIVCFDMKNLHYFVRVYKRKVFNPLLDDKFKTLPN